MIAVGENEVWSAILKAVEKRLDRQSFEQCFPFIIFSGHDEIHHVLHLRAHYEHTKDWVTKYYSRILDDSLAELNLSGYRIEWTVESLKDYLATIPQEKGKSRTKEVEPDDLKGLTVNDIPRTAHISVCSVYEPNDSHIPEFEVHFIRPKSKSLRIIVIMTLNQSMTNHPPLQYSKYIEMLEDVIYDRQKEQGDVRFLNTNWVDGDFDRWLDEDEDTVVRYLAFTQERDLFVAYKQVCNIQNDIINSVNYLMQNVKNGIDETVSRNKTHSLDYDVALSFAGEDRKYVEEVANILHQLGIKVFYDKYEEANLWGKDLYTHLDDVYQRKSEYCVIFISQHYKHKLWTNHERESAQARAFQERREYILPVRFDATEIPGVRPTTAYLNIENRSSKDLAYLIMEKLGRNKELEDMINYLKDYLTNYKITLDGTELVFENEAEQYQGKFPVRLMLEMYRMDMLEHMFLAPAIVPH